MKVLLIYDQIAICQTKCLCFIEFCFEFTMDNKRRWNKYKKSGSFARKKRKYENEFEVANQQNIIPVAVACATTFSSQSFSPNSTPPSSRVSSPLFLDVHYTSDYDEAIDYFSPEEDEKDDEGEVPFSRFLQQWSASFNIRQSALKPLLAELKNRFDQRLPRDPRTLMGTPSSSAKNTFVEMGKGQYWHQGVETCLRRCFQNLNEPLTIFLNINIDGLPIYNNGKAQFWPILFNIEGFSEIKPMIIGLFYGHSKPGKVEDFLQPFVDEILPILTNGLLINGFQMNVKIRVFICDSPARSYIKGIHKNVL